MKLVYLGNLEKFADELAKRVRELFVLKEGGKGLSSNDYTAEDKAKVANIPTDYIKTGLQTETSTADGGTNVYTFTTSSGETSTFTVKNGAAGSAGAKGATGATGAAGQRGSRWSCGTAVTGSGTTGAVFSGTGITDALVNDCYLNTSTGYVYRCTASGNASTAKWAYMGSIKGAAGSAGAKGATGATGAAGQRGSRWSCGTAVTGSGTTGAVFSGTGITDALVNDCYLNTSTGYVYRCTASGNASTAKWAYTGSIKGATGEMGDVDEITEADIGKIIAGTYSG